MKDEYKSMVKAVGKYLNAAAADSRDLRKEAENLSEYVPRTLAKKLDTSLAKITDKDVRDAYRSIGREFEKGAEAIECNKKKNKHYTPSVSREDIRYKARIGVETCMNNLEEDLMEKGKRSSFGEKQTTGRVPEKPSLDVYDNFRDGEVPYGMRYGVWEFDDKEPRT